MTQNDCGCDVLDSAFNERRARIKHRTFDAISHQINRARNYLNNTLYDEINKNTGCMGLCRRIWRNRLLRLIFAIIMLFPTMWLLLILGVYIGTQLCASYTYVLSTNEYKSAY